MRGDFAPKARKHFTTREVSAHSNNKSMEPPSPDPILDPQSLSFHHFHYEDPPPAVLAISTHEECLLYKYLSYESRMASQDPILYYKWGWWTEKGDLTLVEILETELQVDTWTCNIDANSPVHLMKLGAIPCMRSDFFAGNFKICISVDEQEAPGAFREICLAVVGDCLRLPLNVQSTLANTKRKTK